MSYKPKKIVVASGYFNPLHKGHIEYLQKSRQLGDQLIVIVNNDKQVMKKKNFILIPARDRIAVVRELSCVDFVIESIDEDRSVCKTLAMLHPHIFTNGGDQFNSNIPEEKICEQMNIEMVDGLGEKIESSTSIVNRAKNLH